ncbi:transcriptional regulator [Fusibacter sp. A1]|nr:MULTISPECIES: helix-turn-helix transcriptional regulator [unclassified Fusibacter]MCK8058392.1 helix-turn-helix transcriptional regulator [Fusibacter sp. A2]NPE20975.1 helix-turn-helix transcriptional regulator [Fusibacter sp. A1]RXV63191.1 transcriptional regulator [Fusibacter sp. A1]
MINHLRQIRRTQNITQQDLADAVDCTRQTIIALEQNKYNPSLLLALKLSRELNTPVDEIFSLNKEKGSQE